MHNAAMRVLGLDAVYVALPCEDETVAPIMSALAAAGGGGSVTRPHKVRAAAALSHRTHLVRLLGACNTFWGEGGRSSGDNTDVAGVLHAVAVVGGGEAWAIAGTGASSRAAVEAARVAGVSVAIHSRSEERARALAAWAASQGVESCLLSDADLLVNATPLGWNDVDPLPFDGLTFPRVRGAVDMVYRAGETAWIQNARARGWSAVDGREMLLGQGVAAFRRWFPDHAPPLEVMRAAVRRALQPAG